MLKSVLAMVAAMSFVAACGQGPNEEAGEAADTAYEQSTTGTTDPAQGPMEEAGENLDQATDGQPAANSATPPAGTPPATTP